MPSSDWTIQSAMNYHFKQKTVGRQLKFALFPRRCYITNVGYEHRWYSKDEYLIARLKDLI